MKVLLYEQNAKMMTRSGIGRALLHQKKALESRGIEVTFSLKDDYDLVHINSTFNRSYRLLKKLNKKNIPVIVHGHSTFKDFKHSFRCWKIIEPWYDNGLKKMYSNAKYIVSPTEYSKSIIENYSFTSGKVFNVSNGIMLDEYAYNQERVKKFKEYFNIKDNQKVVISTGFYFERKGIHDFFEIARNNQDVTFIWFGFLNKVLTTHKINKAIKNKPDNVIMPGYITGDIIKGAYLAADCFLFPSYEETEGIVVLEALASKIPLIVRDIGVYKHWLVDNKNCLMAKNNKEFEEKMRYVFTHDCSSLVEEGYKVAQERSIEKMGEELEKIYKLALENK